MLRSDTGIRPTEAMRRAMASASDGDDFYGEDADTRALEAVAAQQLGKPAALLFPTGTLANCVAVLAHGCAPDRLLLDAQSHIALRERAAPGPLAAFQPDFFDRVDGYPDVEDLRQWMQRRGSGSALLCLENTQLWRSGKVVNVDRSRSAYQAAQELGMLVHLDGARLFNAAIALKVPLAALAATTDSVMVSLCKGLGAPIGAILAGESPFIENTRKLRTLLGGTLRLSGCVAAPALVAFRAGYAHIANDHAKAQLLAAALSRFDMLGIRPEQIDTNIILFRSAPLGLGPAEFVALAGQAGVGISALPPDKVRLVTHRDVSEKDVIAAGDILQRLIVGRLG